MPDPDRLLHTIRRAIVAFRETAGRRGRYIEPQGAREVLVAGDLHGSLDSFRGLLQRADLGRHPDRHLVLQELIHSTSSYPAGGDRSHQLVDLVAALKCQFPRQVHVLLGNHELSQWTGRRVAKGDLTLNEYFLEGARTAYGQRSGEIYESYLQLFASFALAVRTPNRVFLSHSLPPAPQLDSFDIGVLKRDDLSEADVLPGGPVHSLVWGRDTRETTARSFLDRVDADLLITGHIPCEEGYAVPNPLQLILDTIADPAAYCLFPTTTPLSHADIIDRVHLL